MTNVNMIDLSSITVNGAFRQNRIRASTIAAQTNK